MKGWVYIITNKAMPDLIKIGYSMKDPEIRAIELNHTGTPHPYKVEYEVLVENPRKIEQEIHRILKEKREGKEWFKETTDEAIKTIQKTLSEKIILENLKSPNNTKTDQKKHPKRQEAYKKQEFEWIISSTTNNLHNKNNGCVIGWNDYKIEGLNIIARGEHAQIISIRNIDPESMNTELIEYLKKKNIFIKK